MSELKRKVIKSDTYIGRLDYIHNYRDGPLVDVIRVLQTVIDEHTNGVVYWKEVVNYAIHYGYSDDRYIVLRLHITRKEKE